jgi:putative transposase
MRDESAHRKLVKHYDEPGQAHELTFSCYQRMLLLNDEDRKRLLSQAIDRAITHQGFALIAFVYMPEHVHLVVYPLKARARASALLSAIKRPVSFRIKRSMQDRCDPLLTRLIVRERPGKLTLRFWQEGSGYDRNLTSLATVRATIEYVHRNPVRRGLCASPGDWKWSSWRWYQHTAEPSDPDLPTVSSLPL